MKIWILHNTTYGNGKKVAETLGKVFEKDMEVKIGHIKDVKPEEIVKDKPDAIVIGTFARTFLISGASKSWLRSLKSSLKESNQTIKYGASFMTHGLDKKIAKVWGARFNKMVARGNVIANVYPDWLSGQVADAEGPLKEGVIEELTKQATEIAKWMKK